MTGDWSDERQQRIILKVISPNFIDLLVSGRQAGSTAHSPGVPTRYINHKSQVSQVEVVGKYLRRCIPKEPVPGAGMPVMTGIPVITGTPVIPYMPVIPEFSVSLAKNASPVARPNPKGSPSAARGASWATSLYTLLQAH